ncbi:MAG: hypothetical protein ACQGVK_21975 [Myxococcota bacterium]
MASGGGSKLGAVLLVAIVLGGLGGFNYYRNMQAEVQEEGPRPLAGYDDAGLAALGEAYRIEIEDLQLRRATLRSSADPDAAKGAFIGDNVKQFEQVQRSSRALRDLLGEIAERQGRLAEIEREQQARSRSAGAGMTLHLQRLFTI